MLDLLIESLQTLKRRWQEVLKCFWPLFLVFIYIDVGGQLMPEATFKVGQQQDIGIQPDRWTPFLSMTSVIVFMIVMIAGVGIAMGHGAVRWHRALIAGEPIGFSVGLGSEKGWIYFLKLSVFSMAYVFLLLFCQFIVKSYLLAAFVGQTAFLDTAIAAIGELLATALYVLVFAKLLLTLPEGAMDAPLRGAHRKLPRHTLVALMAALIICYGLSALVTQATGLIASYGEQPFWLILVNESLNWALTILGLTILSLAYRRSLAVKS